MYEAPRAAVLIFAFKRMDSLNKILAVLSTLEARNIYFSIDSEPDTDAPNPLVLETIQGFANRTSHNVRLWTREEHLGLQGNCKRAIHDFFNLETRGIVLDDDIIPSHTFFVSLDVALEEFASNNEVYFINGWTPFFENELPEKPYFTEYFVSWGWASWSRKILKLNFEMKDARKDFLISCKPFGYRHNLGFRFFWNRRYRTVSSPKSRSWDWELLFSLWAKQGKVLSVHERICTNAGYDSLASHPNYGSARQIAAAKPMPVLGQNYWTQAKFSPSIARRNEALLWDLGFVRLKSSLIYRTRRIALKIRHN